MEALGFCHLYGFSPCIDFFKGTDIDVKADDRDLNILVSECADIRHIMKSISDQLPLKKERKHKVNIYIHEKNPENIARDLLFLTLICETGLAKRERMELFLDLYGNVMLRDKTDAYLQGIVNELIQLITEDERCQSVLKPVVDLSQLKFVERDGIEDVFSSWLNVHPFDIEQYRDVRIRARMKSRYDFKTNMIDWDYSFGIKDVNLWVNQREYK